MMDAEKIEQTIFEPVTNGFKILPNQIRFGVFNLNYRGPSVWYIDPIIGAGKIVQIGKFELEKFCLYSTIATAQGSNYYDAISILPMPDFPEFSVIVISLYYGEELNDLDMHERFFQIVIVIPKKFLKQLPSILKLEQQLVSKIKSKIIIDYSELELHEIKNYIIDLLNSNI